MRIEIDSDGLRALVGCRIDAAELFGQYGDGSADGLELTVSDIHGRRAVLTAEAEQDEIAGALRVYIAPEE